LGKLEHYLIIWHINMNNQSALQTYFYTKFAQLWNYKNMWPINTRQSKHVFICDLTTKC